MRLLLDQDVEVDVQDKYHFTPLHEASYHGKLGVTQLLLKRGANVHARTMFGTTPLWYARRDKEMTSLFLDHMRSNQQRSTYSSFLRLFK
jgi:ankyrin repeat protein